jgi:hypothetical protein
MTPSDHDAPLTCRQLAKLLGCRKGNHPTSPETVRIWMLRGLRGVRLFSRVEALARVTTWRHYQSWLDKLNARREEMRQLRLAAVERVRRQF